jgi:hypothetical protein
MKTQEVTATALAVLIILKLSHATVLACTFVAYPGSSQSEPWEPPADARQAGSAERVLTLDELAKYQQAPDCCREDVSVVVEIHTGLPMYRFHLLADPSAPARSDAPRRIGRIEVSTQQSPEVLQTIEVESFAEPDTLVRYFEATDVNFDGYTDIRVLKDFGAKWGSYSYYLFDPEAGRFVTNALTKELGTIGANECKFDPATKTIRVGYLLMGEGVVGEVYAIRDGHVVLVEVDKRTKNSAGKYQIVRRSVGDSGHGAQPTRLPGKRALVQSIDTVGESAKRPGWGVALNVLSMSCGPSGEFANRVRPPVAAHG